MDLWTGYLFILTNISKQKENVLLWFFQSGVRITDFFKNPNIY